MANHPIEIEINAPMFRALPPALFAGYASLLEGSGVVDYLWAYDLLTGWIPPQLWTAESTPAAELSPDSASFHDPAVLLAIASVAAPGLGLALTGTNAIRQNPCELMRTMLSLASATHSRVMVSVGCGENYQIAPFGYKRSEGLARLEDHFRLYKLLWECDRPFDFEGNIWKLSQGYIGTVRPANRPQFWAIGGGPKLMDIAARHADGLITWVPNAYPPEQFARFVQRLKTLVDRYGRDPEEFGIGAQALVVLHDDPEQIERVYQNPIWKFHAATMARTDMAGMARDGFPVLFPEQWNYSLHMMPYRTSAAEVEALIEQVPREMVAGFFGAAGSPKEVAVTLQDYVDAGATFVGPMDAIPLVSPTEWGGSIERLLEVARLLKTASN